MARTKNPAAVALGRLGGKARMRNLTPEERSRIARLGGLARHGKLDSDPEPDPTGTDPGNVRSLAEAAKKRGRAINPPTPATTARDAGRKGGKARAAKLTPEQRSEAARAAINARWAKVRASKAVAMYPRSVTIRTAANDAASYRRAA